MFFGVKTPDMQTWNLFKSAARDTNGMALAAGVCVRVRPLPQEVERAHCRVDVLTAGWRAALLYGSFGTRVVESLASPDNFRGWSW